MLGSLIMTSTSSFQGWALDEGKKECKLLELSSLLQFDHHSPFGLWLELGTEQQDYYRSERAREGRQAWGSGCRKGEREV